MSKEEFLNYIIDFAVDTLWDNKDEYIGKEV